MDTRMSVKQFMVAMMKRLSDRKSNVLFIKHYNTLDVSKESVESCCDEQLLNKPYFLYYQYSTKQMQEAYAPFLGWIKDLYERFYKDTMSAEAFIEECRIYSLHKETFITFIKTGVAIRTEDIIPSEVDYEMEQMLFSILQIFKFVSWEHTIFIVLNQFHFTSDSTAMLLLKFIEEDDISNLAILITFNEVYQVPIHIADVWSQLIEVVEDKNILIDWGMLGSQKTYLTSELFILVEEHIESYIVNIENMIATLALNQAEFYLNYILNKVEREKYIVNKEIRSRLYVMKIKCCILRKDLSKALLSCDNLLSIINVNEDREQYFYYHYYLGLSQIGLFQQTIAKKSVKECYKIAYELEDEMLLFRASLLEFYTKYLGWADLFVCDYSFKISGDFEQKLKDHSYKNTLAYFYGFEFGNDSKEFEQIANGTIEPEYLNRAIEIAKDLENQNLILAIYIKYIIKYTDAGYHIYADKLYAKRFEVLKMMNNPVREGYAYIGLGYNFIVRECYGKANELFNQGLRIMYDVRSSENVAEVLYNMAINCFMAGEYSKSNEYVLTILKIIRFIGIPTIHICNKSKLYGLVALNNYFMNFDYNCYLYLSKLEVNIRHLFHQDKIDLNYWGEDLLLFHFLKGLLLKREGLNKEALEHFEKAKIYYDDNEGAKFFYCVIFTVELSKVYEALGFEEKAKICIEDGISFCLNKGYSEKAKKIKSSINEMSRKAIRHYLPLTEVTIKDILAEAKLEGTKIQLEEKQKSINFLAAWQDMLSKLDISCENLISNAMPAMQNSFKLDGLIFASEQKEQFIIEYIDSEFEVTMKHILEIRKFFEEKRDSFVSNRDDKNFIDYKEIIQIFGEDNITSIIGIPIISNKKVCSFLVGYSKMKPMFRTNREELTENELEIAKFTFNQLLDKIEHMRAHSEIEKMNERLKKIAVTDQLTGLYNRQGFLELVEKYCSQKSVTNSHVVLYIDLDNFKHFNDSCGHDVGDEILVLFGELLIECTKNSGYVIRYGGDEFLIILPNRTVEFGVSIAKLIDDRMDSYLDTNMEKYYNKYHQAAKTKKLSCSIGISSFLEFNKESVCQAVCESDEALYQMKHNSKGSYKVFNHKNRAN